MTTNGTIDWSATLAAKKINKSKERTANTTTHKLMTGGMGVAYCFNAYNPAYYYVSNNKISYANGQQSKSNLPQMYPVLSIYPVLLNHFESIRS